MTTNRDKSLSFILSTGRTGTQFFSRYLTETCDQLKCLHEPMISWQFKWYSNYYLKGKLSEEFIAKQYAFFRHSILKDKRFSHYVESSNFIFAAMNPLTKIDPDLSVLHIVRDPLSYTTSHLNKGFWLGIKKFTAKYLPGWLEFLEPEILRSNDPALILLARWIYVNRVISAYERDLNYKVVRFEDVFGRKAESPAEVLNDIRLFFGCEMLDETTQEKWLHKPANISKKNIAERWPITEKHIEYLVNNGSDLIEKFNYKVEQ